MRQLLDLQILATLAYSDQFDFPLSVAEIAGRLISAKFLVGFLKKRSKFLSTEKYNVNWAEGLVFSELVAQVQAQVDKLIDSKLVELIQGEYYCLSRETAESPETKAGAEMRSRNLAGQYSKKIRSSADKLIGLAIKFPWVRAVGITGSVAVGGAVESDDLDLVVVTSRNRLWLTRWLFLVLTLFWGKRNFFWQKKKDEWCFNLWLEENDLKIPVSKHNLYSAFEVAQIDWWYQRGAVESQFCQQNQWLSEFLYFWGGSTDEESVVQPDSRNWFDQLLGSVNQLLFESSRWYLHYNNRIPLSNLCLSQAFLHDSDSFKRYLNHWEQICLQSIEQSYQNL
jgi:hypothetical protein